MDARSGFSSLRTLARGAVAIDYRLAAFPAVDIQVDLAVVEVRTQFSSG